MANAFSKEEIVAFEDILTGFEDALVMSRNVARYETDQQQMERTGDVIWRPMPYIARSFDGRDQTANFAGQTQLSVPATIGFYKSSPWTMTATELRDALQQGRLGQAASQKLASDVNVAILNTAAFQGTCVVKRAVAASGFDDLAQADAIFNETGVPMGSDVRKAIFSSRDMNSMASNLAGRQTFNGIPVTAYEKALVTPDAAGFEVFKSDYMPRLALAAGGAITVGAANQFYVPRATSTAATGEVSNVDNRYQLLTVSATANVKAGDSFQFTTGVESVHAITKAATGQKKTFRVIEVVSGTVLKISPAIISAQGGSVAEQQYQNVSSTPVNGDTIVWLNTAVGYLNPFWHRDSIELLPGKLAWPTDAGAAVMTSTLTNGIPATFVKQVDIKTGTIFYRLDTLFGTVCTNPEMAGILMFSQP